MFKQPVFNEPVKSRERDHPYQECIVHSIVDPFRHAFIKDLCEGVISKYDPEVVVVDGDTKTTTSKLAHYYRGKRFETLDEAKWFASNDYQERMKIALTNMQDLITPESLKELGFVNNELSGYVEKRLVDKRRVRLSWWISYDPNYTLSYHWRFGGDGRLPEWMRFQCAGFDRERFYESLMKPIDVSTPFCYYTHAIKRLIELIKEQEIEKQKPLDELCAYLDQPEVYQKFKEFNDKEDAFQARLAEYRSECNETTDDDDNYGYYESGW